MSDLKESFRQAKLALKQEVASLNLQNPKKLSVLIARYVSTAVLLDRARFPGRRLNDAVDDITHRIDALFKDIFG